MSASSAWAHIHTCTPRPSTLTVVESNIYSLHARSGRKPRTLSTRQSPNGKDVAEEGVAGGVGVAGVRMRCFVGFR